MTSEKDRLLGTTSSAALGAGGEQKQPGEADRAGPPTEREQQPDLPVEEKVETVEVDPDKLEAGIPGRYGSIPDDEQPVFSDHSGLGVYTEPVPEPVEPPVDSAIQPDVEPPADVEQTAELADENGDEHGEPEAPQQPGPKLDMASLMASVTRAVSMLDRNAGAPAQPQDQATAEAVATLNALMAQNSTRTTAAERTATLAINLITGPHDGARLLANELFDQVRNRLMSEQVTESVARVQDAADELREAADELINEDDRRSIYDNLRFLPGDTVRLVNNDAVTMVVENVQRWNVSKDDLVDFDVYYECAWISADGASHHASYVEPGLILVTAGELSVERDRKRLQKAVQETEQNGGAAKYDDR